MRLGGIADIVFPIRTIIDAGLRALGLESQTDAEASKRRSMCTGVTIEFDCAIPSKKNKLRPRGSGKSFVYDKIVKKQMGDLLLFARSQWGGRPPMKSPDLHFWLDAQPGQDRDGMIVTLMDVFKKAGILEDDAIRVCNGIMVIYPATSGSAKSRVRIDFPRPPAEQVQ